MHVYNLRVRRQLAGNKFPFDRVYIARNGEHKVFQKLFRYALILPVEDKLKEMLTTDIVIQVSVSVPFDRDDQAKGVTVQEWEALLEDGHWVMCVPILPKFVAGNMPRYITAAGSYRLPKNSNTRAKKEREGLIKEIFPALTYLQTPEKNIRPVCVACPRFLLHQNGECSLGEKICYESLALGVHNHFEEAMAVPEAPANFLEMDD